MAQEREAKFREVMDLLRAGGDTLGLRTLDRVAEATYRREHADSRYHGNMSRARRTQWSSVFDLLQRTDRAAARVPSGYYHDGSKTYLIVAPATVPSRITPDIKIPYSRVLVADGYVEITITGGPRFSGYRPLVLLPDGSAISSPDTFGVYHDLLCGLEWGDDRERETLLAAIFRKPKYQRGVLPVEVLEPAPAAVPGTVPASVISASALLKNMVEDMDLSPAELFQHLPVDPALADSVLADMNAFLALGRRFLPLVNGYFMPQHAAAVAALAHFLGIDSVCDHIVRCVGELMSFSNGECAYGDEPIEDA